MRRDGCKRGDREVQPALGKRHAATRLPAVRQNRGCLVLYAVVGGREARQASRIAAGRGLPVTGALVNDLNRTSIQSYAHHIALFYSGCHCPVDGYQRTGPEVELPAVVALL